ncbi:DNA excision repair protein ERCC-6-like 2 [Vanrija pseudolonga]|uniref:DNA excision repair protein ERCC-6-like 2 n=1 Tax=Vanrija pseudolonga TaxID=143232 RepID=A0AAF0Y2B1_9TREE|nr:DNA excision repair protein ERCC-6-like 2 [Vanrija pseudolonga]
MSRVRLSKPSSSSSRSSRPSAVQPKPPPNPIMRARASPVPEDDFEMVALAEAKEYAAVQENAAARKRVSEENAERKKKGLAAKKLPPKIVPNASKGKGRALRSSSSNSGEQSSGDEMEYEGQVKLGFNPLPLLAKTPLDTPVASIREADVRAKRRSESTPSPARKVTPSRPPRTSERQPMSPDVKPKIEPDVKPKIEVDVKPKIERGVKIEPDVKPKIEPDTTPDTKPVLQVKLEPGIDASSLPDSRLNIEARGKDEGDQDIPATVVKSEPQPPENHDDAESEVLEEDDDYDEEDMIVTVPWASSGQNVTHAGVEDADLQPETLEEEDDQYSDDDLFDYSTSTGEPSQKMDESIGGSVAKWEERPNFPATPEQRLKGPYLLDKDNPTMAVPASINRFLRDYQREGAQFMYNKYKQGVGGILGDDMGLGKTVQVISFLSAVMRKTGTSQDEGRRKLLIRGSGKLLPPRQWPTALIVVPTSLIPNWGFFEYKVWATEHQQAVKEQMLGGYLDIVLISSGMMARSSDTLKDLEFSSIVIVDEAHRLKKPDGLLTLAVKKMKTQSCFALTGTLIQNRMDEMWSVLDFVRRGWAGTLDEWREYAVNPIKRGHRHDGTVEAVVRAVMRTGEVSKKILPHFYLRRDKRLIASELPQKRDLVVLCPLGRNQAAVYQRIIDSPDVAFILHAHDPCECGSNETRRNCCHRENAIGDSYPATMLKMFDALGRVANQQISRRVFEFCHTTLRSTASWKRHSGVPLTNRDPNNCGKWNLLETLLKEWRRASEENNKVLIFSNSVRLLKMIKEFIDISDELAGVDCDVFSGDVDKSDRMAMVDKFQDPNQDMFVMLVSTLAGGVGLNLTAANKVVIFDPSWNPANDLQAMDRAFRIGQKRPVDVYRLVGQGTVEEVMYERQIYKQQRARQMNDGTFERRTHTGYEGAQHKEDKGELFGVHNIFKFDPQGFVKGNLERIRLAEDQIRLDLIEGEYDEEPEVDGDESDDEMAKEVRAQRRAKALKHAIGQPALEDESLLSEINSDGVAQKPKTDDDVLKQLGVTSLQHDSAFRDSAEERDIFEIGLKILAQRPDLKDIKANDAGKVRLRDEKKPKRKSRGGDDEPDYSEQPWAKRFSAGKTRNKGKVLAGLDDDEEVE